MCIAFAGEDLKKNFCRRVAGFLFVCITMLSRLQKYTEWYYQCHRSLVPHFIGPILIGPPTHWSPNTLLEIIVVHEPVGLAGTILDE